MDTKIINPLSMNSTTDTQGWQEMYPYYLLFSNENHSWEIQQFWFHDSMHHPRPLLPFETIIPECIRLGLGQNNTRIFSVPSAYGIEQRIFNGYVYFSPIEEKDPGIIQQRVDKFRERTSYYYKNWDKAYISWQEKVKDLINNIKNINFSPLPEIEEDNIVLNFIGKSKGYELLKSYNTLIDYIFLAWQYHFEMLNVGYIAYLNFIQFCKNYFPSISDQDISSMIKGFDSLLFKPEQKLKELAEQAISYSIENVILENDYNTAFSILETQAKGREWLQHLEDAKDPWFYYSKGNGFYILDGSWIDDLDFPFQKIKTYIDLIKKNQLNHVRLEDKKLKSLEISTKYKNLLLNPTLQKQFDHLLQQAKMVAFYLEDHNFYIENWLHTIFWQKLRILSEVIRHHEFIENACDLWFLNRWEVGQLLYELAGTWASGGKARGPDYWQSCIKKRKSIFKALEATRPLPVLGTIPDRITEPLTLALFGITDKVVKSWFQKKEATRSFNSIYGLGAVKGCVEGKVRVITRPEDFLKFKNNEIIVCQSLAPSWITYFKSAKAVIADIGGIMSHTAILCREYNVPCVVAATGATYQLKTGDTVIVDGTKGTIEIVKHEELVA